MTAATASDVHRAVAAECDALAELVADSPPALWDMPSLCVGWRVREVVAHVTMPARYSTGRFLLEIARDRGNFNRMSDRCARRDSVLAPTELVAGLVSEALKNWKPPGGGYEGALVHVVMHGLDIVVPAGIPRQVPADRMAVVLSALTQPGSLKHFGVEID